MSTRAFGRLLPVAFGWHCLDGPPGIGRPVVEGDLQSFLHGKVFEVVQGDVTYGYVQIKSHRRRCWVPSHLVMTVSIREELRGGATVQFAHLSATYNKKEGAWVLGEDVPLGPGRKEKALLVSFVRQSLDESIDKIVEVMTGADLN